MILMILMIRKRVHLRIHGQWLVQFQHLMHHLALKHYNPEDFEPRNRGCMGATEDSIDLKSKGMDNNIFNLIINLDRKLTNSQQDIQITSPYAYHVIFTP